MKSNYKLKGIFLICTLFVAALIYITGCQPEAIKIGNGLSSKNLKAAFTVTPVTGKTNTYALKADETGVIALKWDKGTGTSTLGKAIDTVAFPDAGTYTIKLTVIGIGGEQNTTSQDVVVATSDPVAGNIIQGGKFNEGDNSKWTVTKRGTAASVQFTGGKAVFNGSNYDGIGIYQSVEIIANKKYKLNMTVSGSEAKDCWFEVYMGQSVPVDGSDYSEGGNIMGLNTWNGCGMTPFNGKLTDLACSGDHKDGILTFSQGGTYYLVIRGGAGTTMGPNGISLDDVELRGTN